jgi:hypothetical protein
VSVPDGVSHSDPALEAMLPEQVRGVVMLRSSGPLINAGGSGDLCALMCSDAPRRFAEAAGLSIDDLNVAVAYPEDGALAVIIVAIRFPGVATNRLIDIRLMAGPRSGGSFEIEKQAIKVGTRTILWTTYWPWYKPYDNEYLYASGDVLYLLLGAPPVGGEAPQDVVLAVDQLP